MIYAQERGAHTGTAARLCLRTDDDVACYGVAGPGRNVTGPGGTLRSRLAAHLQGQHAPGRGTAKPFNFEVTRLPMSRERSLLEGHKRANWRLPPDNDGL